MIYGNVALINTNNPFLKMSILEAGNNILSFIEESCINEGLIITEDYCITEGVNFKEKLSKVKEKIVEFFKKAIKFFKEMASKLKNFVIKIKNSVFGKSIESQHADAEDNFLKWLDEISKREKQSDNRNKNSNYDDGKGSIPSIDFNIPEVTLEIIDKEGIYYYVNSFDFDHESFYKNYVNDSIFMDAYFKAEKIIMDETNDSNWMTRHTAKDKDGKVMDYDSRYDRQLNGYSDNKIREKINSIKRELRTNLFNGIVNCVRGDKKVNAAINVLKGNKESFINDRDNSYQNNEALGFFETIENHTQEILKNKSHRLFDNLKDLDNEYKKMKNIENKVSDFHKNIENISKTYEKYASTFKKFYEQSIEIIDQMNKEFDNRFSKSKDVDVYHPVRLNAPYMILFDLIHNISFVVNNAKQILNIQSSFEIDFVLKINGVFKKYETAINSAMKLFVNTKLSEGYSLEECKKAINKLL